MSLVLDSSATLAWIYSEETTEEIRQVFEAVADHGVIVPALWRLEVANNLTVVLRRRINATFFMPHWPILRLLDIITDQTRIFSPGAKH